MVVQPLGGSVFPTQLLLFKFLLQTWPHFARTTEEDSTLMGQFTGNQGWKCPLHTHREVSLMKKKLIAPFLSSSKQFLS